MKKCYYFLMVMLMALVSFGFSACGDDDEPKDTAIVGTWVLDTEDLSDAALLFQFTKDGKFHEVQTAIINGETYVGDVFHGTYTASGNKLTITYIFQYETETVDCIYTVKGDKLSIKTVDGTVTFTRVSDSVIAPYL